MARPTTAPELTVLNSAGRYPHTRLLLEDPDGVMQDITSFAGEDWLEALEFGANVDEPIGGGVVELRREINGVSLAPLVEGSPLNEDAGGLYAPFVSPGRRFEILIALLPAGQFPDGGTTWTLLAEGRTDDVQFGGRSPRIVVEVRDPMARWHDTIIETVGTYGNDASPVPIETVMQQILDDNFGPSIYPLRTVGLPDFGIKEYELGNVSVLDALVALRDLIGWNLHWRWNPGTSQLQGTFYEPARAGGAAQHIIGPDDYYEVTDLHLAQTRIRNAGEVLYTDVNGDEQVVSDERPASIALYDRRFIRFDERGGQIRTATGAQALLDAALDDLEAPPAIQTIECAFWWPIELGDIIQFQPNDRHYDVAQTWAVYGYRHIIRRGQPRTIIDVSGKASGGFERWHRRAHLLDRTPDDEEAEPRVIPVVSLLPRQVGTTGFLRLEISDPENIVTGVFFKPHSGGGDVDFSDPADMTWTADTVLPYEAQVAIVPKHTSVIGWAVRYTDPDTLATAFLQGAYRFDLDVVPEVTAIAVSFSGTGRIVVAAVADEDAANLYVTADVDADPPDPTAVANDETIPGRAGLVTTDVFCGLGLEARVKVVAEDANGVLGPVRQVNERRGFGLKMPFDVHAEPTQTGNVGTLELTITDPSRAITAVEYQTRQGAGDFGGTWLDTWDVSTGGAGGDVTLVRAKDITLSAKHTSEIKWRITYTDVDGLQQTRGGSHTFDLDLVAEVTGVTVGFAGDSSVVVGAHGDEDVRSNGTDPGFYVQVGIGSDPPNPTAGANDGAITPSAGERSGTVVTSVICPTGSNAHVKVVAVDAGGGLGPVAGPFVVRNGISESPTVEPPLRWRNVYPNVSFASPATLTDDQDNPLDVSENDGFVLQAINLESAGKESIFATLRSNGTTWTIGSQFGGGSSNDRPEIFIDSNVPKVRLAGGTNAHDVEVSFERARTLQPIESPQSNDAKFVIDYPNALLTVTDEQVPAVERVLLGKLPIGGQTGYGIEIFDASGDLILGATGLGFSVVNEVNIADGAVSTVKLGDASVTTQKIAGGSVTTAKIGNAQVTTQKLENQSVTEAKIGNQSVTTTKIGDNVVTQIKMSSGLFVPEIVSSLPSLPDPDYPQGATVVLTTDDKLYRSTGGAWTAAVPTVDLTGQIGSAIIADGSITTVKLDDAAVTTEKLDNGSITTVKIQNAQITTSKLDNQSVTTAKIGNLSVTTTKLADGSIVSDKLVDGSVLEQKLADLAVTTAKLADNSVLEEKLANVAVTTAKLANNSVLESKLANLAVTTAKLANDAVVQGKLADFAVTTPKIADDAVENAKLANYAISGSKIDGMARGQHGVFLETFEQSPGSWQSFGGGTFLHDNASGAVTGGHVIRVDSPDDLRLVFPQNIPFDSTKLYRIRVRVLAGLTADPANQRFFCGVHGVAADGTTLVNRNGADTIGSQHYLAANNVDLAAVGGWQEFTGWFQGWGATEAENIFNNSPTNPAKLHPDVRYIRPMFLANYQNAGAGNRTNVDYIAIDVFDEDAEVRTYLGLNVDGVVAADKVVSASIVANAIDTVHIAAGAVNTNQLAAEAVTAGKIAANTITAAQIKANAIGTSELQADAVTAGQIAADAITANHIQSGAVDTLHLAADAVTAGKIAVGSITTAHMQSGAVDTAELRADAVTAAKIAAGSINAGHIQANAVTANEIAGNTIVAGNIAAGAIGTSELAAGSVTAGIIAANAVNAGKIAAGAVNTSELAADAVTADKIDANTIVAANIAAGAIGTSELAAGSVVASKIAADAIVASKIAAGAVVADAIAADAVTAAKINAGAVDTVHLAAGSVTAGKISANAVTASKIAANAVTAGKISVGQLSAISSNIGTITAGTIQANVIIASDTFTADDALFEGNVVLDGSSLFSAVRAEAHGQSGTTKAAVVLIKNGNTDYNGILFRQGGGTGERFWLRQGGNPWPLEFRGNFNTAFRFHTDGTGEADVAWTTFSPAPPKAAAEMSCCDWLDWACQDACKPLKPYEGLPTEDHPEVRRIAEKAGRDPIEVAIEEGAKYRKDPAKVAIGTARWAEAFMAALATAKDLADLKQSLGIGEAS